MTYRLIRQLGRGGMAEVYEARELMAPGKELPVAIKILRPDYLGSETMCALFEREALISRQHCHNHANLVTVLAYGVSSNDRPYLVMEYVDGSDLGHLRRSGALPPSHLRAIALHALTALDHLHANGVLHRDVSPNNIMISSDGVVKLADLGLAKSISSVSSGRFFGTAPYASLEALQAQPLDERADLYSLGAVLHELVAGVPPYGVGEPAQLYERMLSGAAAHLPEDTPEDIVKLIRGLTAPLREQRAFTSADQVIEYLLGQEEPIASAEELSMLAVERFVTRPPQEEAPRLSLVGQTERVDEDDSFERAGLDDRPSANRGKLASAAILLAFVAMGLGMLIQSSLTRTAAPAEAPARIATPAETRERQTAPAPTHTDSIEPPVSAIAEAPDTQELRQTDPEADDAQEERARPRVRHRRSRFVRRSVRTQKVRRR